MQLRRSALSSLLFVALAAMMTACGDDDPTSAPDAGDDAAGLDGSSSKCATSIQCDDGLYCNGDELCAPFLLSANAFGCVPARPPCGTDEVCDEDTDTCGPMPIDAGEPDAAVDGGELDASVEVDGGELDASVEVDGGEPDAAVEVDGGEPDAAVDGGELIDLG